MTSTGNKSQMSKIIDPAMIVKEAENPRGNPLSMWMQLWLNWLHASSVNYHNRPGEVLFTRGAVTFIDLPNGRRVQDTTYHNKDEDENGNFLGEYITTETAIYVDVMPAFYFIDENYTFPLKSVHDCLEAVRFDTCYSKGIYCTLEKDGQEIDLRPMMIYVESPVQIIVPSYSELARSFKTPVELNNQYIGAVGGYMLFIKSLEPGTYVLSAGGVGVFDYITNYRYQIRVTEGDGTNLFTDVERFMQKEPKLAKNKSSPLKSSKKPSPIKFKQPK